MTRVKQDMDQRLVDYSPQYIDYKPGVVIRKEKAKDFSPSKSTPRSKGRRKRVS